MRGKAIWGPSSLWRVRITPAYAGKSLTILILYTDRWDHPRVCGEKDVFPHGLTLAVDHPRVCGEKAGKHTDRITTQGSPPRMRGKECSLVPADFPGGITPAYAGKSRENTQTALPRKDHPRVCGEKLNVFAFFFRQWGSPPRMRGKVRPLSSASNTPGITPAYAGKSARRLWMPWPRLGSPPRMRGKESGQIEQDADARITPAYAGKRGLAFITAFSPADHPRVCGEKAKSSRTYRKRSGSPPRMRGKGRIPKAGRLVVGITPAYAGKRLQSFLRCVCPRDHPRVCGEK